MADIRTVAYISCTDSHDIYVIELSEDGALKVIQKVRTVGKVMPLAVSPEKRSLYASIRSEPFSISRFLIDKTSGQLSEVETVPLAGDMVYICTDKTGRWLLAASYYDNLISVNAIYPDGRVDAKPAQVIPTGEKPHCIVADPSNRFVFATNLGEDRILQFRFDQNSGELTPNDPPAAESRGGAGPRHLTFHPSLPLLYCSNELDATVSIYSVDASGRLTFGETHSLLPQGFVGKPWAADLHVTPDGRHLYVSERSSSTVAAFRIGSGRPGLAFVGRYDTATQPRAFGVSPDGKSLIAVGEKSDRACSHEIDNITGELHLRSQPAVGSRPTWVEFVSLDR